MKFRPCIDIHNGKVKQIVGGSLKDETRQQTIFSEQDAAWYAEKYKKDGLKGGHIILFNSEIPNILRLQGSRHFGAFGISGRYADRRRYHGR